MRAHSQFFDDDGTLLGRDQEEATAANMILRAGFGFADLPIPLDTSNCTIFNRIRDVCDLATATPAEQGGSVNESGRPGLV